MPESYMHIELHQASKWKRQMRGERLVLRIESICLEYVFLVIDLFLGIHFYLFVFSVFIWAALNWRFFWLTSSHLF